MTIGTCAVVRIICESLHQTRREMATLTGGPFYGMSLPELIGREKPVPCAQLPFIWQSTEAHMKVPRYYGAMLVGM